MDSDRSLQGLHDTLKDLSAEATVQRRALEHIMEQLADYDKPIDYSAQIAGLDKEMARVTERIGALMQVPALANGSEKLLQKIAVTSHQSVGQILQAFNTKLYDLDTISTNLRSALKSHRAWEQQARALKWRLFYGMVAGALLALLACGSFFSALLWISQDQIAWALTPQGREAHELAAIDGISQFLECSREGWTIARSMSGNRICLTGNTHGWFLP